MSPGQRTACSIVGLCVGRMGPQLEDPSVFNSNAIRNDQTIPSVTNPVTIKDSKANLELRDDEIWCSQGIGSLDTQRATGSEVPQEHLG